MSTQRDDEDRIQAVRGFCSYCGRLVPGGGEVGCIDNDEAHSFATMTVMANGT